MDASWKRAIMVVGMLLFLVGLLFTFNAFCIATILLMGQGNQQVAYGAFSGLMVLLTLGVGTVLYLQAEGSLKNKPSRPLRLPPTILFVGVFAFCLMLGLPLSVRNEPGIFVPPILLVMAVLPSLWAVSLFTPRADSDTTTALTWRRGLIAFCGGATLSVLLALVLEILIPLTVLALLFNPVASTLSQLDDLISNTNGAALAKALTNPAFVYFFIQIAVIAPLVEELVKPLVTLPLLRQLNRQQAFWVGALAGAGFAAVENVIYACSGLAIWPGILLVRAIGGALHPLGAGLVTLGWRDVLHRESNAPEKWFKQYGFAVLIHAIWNGGSLLVITLGSAQVFGVLPPNIDVLGLSMAGTTLAFLILLGIAALWLGHAYGHNRPLWATPTTPTASESPSGTMTDPAPETAFVFSERATALWALACLLAIVPIGIAGLKLWLR